ncbi:MULTISPECIES: SDR family oxidoreductase [Rhodobacterales]|uniref:Short chain dehydrogenase n=1 Tax=Thioclava atlantica TaxID=1317124 RepID=A0A085TU59_9RHOB|nr:MULTISPECIES: SDR family oxidoreductase [Rhodobacterales]KFE34256.1 short chain dehydrogenase [Thioclava atlantica]
MSHSVKDEITLITGASSGLGAGMAREIAARGGHLALCARRIEQLEALKAEITAARPACRVEIAALDVTDADAVAATFADFRARMGRLDRVVINAGIGRGAPVGKGGWAENRATLETNLIAAFAQAEAAMAAFRDQNKGHLVVMSSMSAIRGMRGAMTAYATSKAGVAAMAEGLRAECLNKPGIDVTTIFAGYIRTELNAHVPASKTPWIIGADKGARLLVDAIARRPATAFVPRWPWAPLGALMRVLPLPLVSKIT